MNEKTFPDMVGGNYFVELNAINVSDKIEKKNGLSYLSWAYAWGELNQDIKLIVKLQKGE